ncbi:MAG TPA: hypothetical protein VLA47_07755 [Nitrospira sp.]|jgi:hypothetical protein|nr:hypothetical protein [Nitrospira sp.]
MEPGFRRTTFGRIAAALGCLCGVIGLLTGVSNRAWILSPHGWGTGGVLLLLLAVFVLLDAAVSFERSRALPKL